MSYCQTLWIGWNRTASGGIFSESVGELDSWDHITGQTVSCQWVFGCGRLRCGWVCGLEQDLFKCRARSPVSSSRLSGAAHANHAVSDSVLQKQHFRHTP